MTVDQFAPYQKRYGCFIVRNITPDRNKTIKIFTYPINFNCTRDLLQIPGVSEQDIRASLLKGELRHKILARDIVVECSDIDLLQFNLDQKAFLQDAGIVNGLQVTSENLSVLKKEDIQLLGAVDDSNTVFTIPFGKFIQNVLYKIIVYKNGVKQFFLDDYFIAESGGPGSGYDTVIFVEPPTTTPPPDDIITADYYLDNT
jgi:hypothetical protein